MFAQCLLRLQQRSKLAGGKNGKETAAKSAKPIARQKSRGRSMSLQARVMAALVLLCSAVTPVSETAYAQEFDFSQIDRFESFGTGTLHVGSPPRTIVDDDERHVVILTIWDADADTKVYWRSPDGNVPRTTIVPGKGVQTFETAGEFKIEALGDPNYRVDYGYVLLGLRKHQ